MKRIIGLMIIIITMAGCESSSKTAQAPEDTLTQDQRIKHLENRIDSLEDDLVKLVTKDSMDRWRLDTRIKKLEKQISMISFPPDIEEKQPPEENLSTEDRVAKLEGQVARLWSEMQKTQQLRAIPISPESEAVSVK